jgi:putative ABC transport system substrate-binding protein
MQKGYLVQSIVSFSDNLKSKSGPADKNPKLAGMFAIALTFIFGGAAVWAQQPKKVPRICYLAVSSASFAAEGQKPFRDRLREIGYVEGQNIVIEYRYAEGKTERLPELAAELVRLNCQVIVTQGIHAVRATKNATRTIPVVMAFGPDAVRGDIVAELARPGGNVTGMTDMGAEMYGKRLEILKETVPKLARVVMLYPSNLDTADILKETETVARFLRVGIQFLKVKGPNDIEGAFRAATKGRANGLILPTSGFFSFHRKRIVDLVEKNRLPAMYSSVGYVEAGGLMFYGEDRSEMFQRAAEIVDMILKGTKPADIPVERPKKFDFVINLKAAKLIGLTVPPEVLARASRIIR